MLLFTESVRDGVRFGKQMKCVFNSENNEGQRAFLESSALVKSFSLPQIGWDVSLAGISGRVGVAPFQSPLFGRFNAENIAVAGAVGRALGFSDIEIARGIEFTRSVPGRMEKVENTWGYSIWVDYAHKPDAMEKVLINIQKVRNTDRKLWVVFGCGGDRDRSKRPLMARLAETYADHVIVTSDNPRTENPDQIISEIASGFTRPDRVIFEKDRKSAIEKAILTMKPRDLLLILGKGHETYQILGTTKISFDDREVANQALTRIFKNQ
jgi:UDP-N-acetylmuramoyl-L-alanyl-D-glutamate--2,6-diaminopimelate ligase